MAPDPKVQRQITEHRREATRLRREAALEKVQEETAERKAVEYEAQARKVSLDFEVASAKAEAARAQAAVHGDMAESARRIQTTARGVAERLEADAKAIAQTDPNRAADLREEAAKNMRSVADAAAREREHSKLENQANADARRYSERETAAFKKSKKLWDERDEWEKKAEAHETWREALLAEAMRHEDEVKKIEDQTASIEDVGGDDSVAVAASAVDDAAPLLPDPDRLDDSSSGEAESTIADAEPSEPNLFEEPPAEIAALAAAEEPAFVDEHAVDTSLASADPAATEPTLSDPAPAIVAAPEPQEIAAAEVPAFEDTETKTVDEMADVVEG